MGKQLLLKIGSTPVYWDPNESRVWFTGEFTIDADGAPNAYGAEPPNGSDWLANAGYPGNWWGISCDASGKPYVQQKGDKHRWPFPGYYISTTAYEWRDYPTSDCRRYVDSSKVAFTVIPGNVRMAVPPKFMGCTCRVTDKKTRKVFAGVACCDVGPSNHCGEGSIYLASLFGLDPSPKTGGSSDHSRFLWEFWPGIESESHPLQ